MAAALEGIGQALQYLQAGHVAQAENCCRLFLQTTPSDPDAWYLLGVACQVQGKIDEAAASYEQALCLRPDYAEAHSNLGALYVNQGRWQEAERFCRQVWIVEHVMTWALQPASVGLPPNILRLLIGSRRACSAR